MKRIIVERPNGRNRVIQECEGESRTEQHHGNEVNINKIVSRYQKTGILPAPAGSPRYGDFSGVTDYHAALDSVHEAEAAFMTLPASLRKAFDNDPGSLLTFLADEENREEAIELGLIDKPDDYQPDPPVILPPKGSPKPSDGETTPDPSPTS